MVSFFGLKLGGDKKKKNDKSANLEGPQPKDGDSDFFGTTLNKQDLLHLDASTPIPRPGTASSNRSLPRPKLPYMHGSGSMVDLAAGAGASFHATQQSSIGSGVRHYGSETNLRTRWNNASSTSLVPPPMTPAAANGRPGTAGSNRGTGWVNPLDVHFCRDGSSGSTPSRTQQQQRPSTSSGAKASTPIVASTAPQIPRSPLGQFEFNLSPLDVSSPATLQPVKPLRRAETSPMQLQPASAVDENRTLKLTKSHSPPRSYPSPPPSLNSTEKPWHARDNPSTRRGNVIPPPGFSTAGKIPRRPQNIDSLPSPASSHEDQEMGSWDRPDRRRGAPGEPPPPVDVRGTQQPHGPPRGPPPQMRGPPRPWPPPAQRMPNARPRPHEPAPRIAPPPVARTGLPLRSPVEPDHPSKGPQDFNLPPRRPQPSPVIDADRSYGLSPANRRAAPPRLNVPAPPLRDEGSPLSPSYQFPKFDEGDTFSSPRQAPSPLGASPRLQQESPKEPPPGASSWPLADGGGADVSKPHAPLVSPSFRERSPPPQWAEDRRKVERAKTPPLEGGVGMGTRPDFGLRAPTGIADEFQVGFI
ncbi:predicted protein [Verticillium alfalfae VaMs.102]|uniref:Predicted protein n=1 Tax=Verticillium alfalfae (strain VaMs.102 / ATCC MYA-4576 / FGSC 10136) TaxID=526221 RepID=C9S9Q0_VERA1|nr:predicted protein [Verticillium alfalfae VaMs.102]EEY16113.1 predicted protein [Verticillium alfalfae VaMs.102]